MKNKLIWIILPVVVAMAIVLAVCLKKPPTPEPVQTVPKETPKATMVQKATPEPTETTAETVVPTETPEALDEDILTQRGGIFG